MEYGLASIVGPEKFTATYQAFNPELKVVTVEQGGQGGVIDPQTGKYTPLFVAGNPPAGGSAPQTGGGGQYQPARNYPAPTVRDMRRTPSGALIMEHPDDYNLIVPGMTYVGLDGQVRQKR